MIPTCFWPQFSKWESRLTKYTNITPDEIDELKNLLLNITQQLLFRTCADLQKLIKLQSLHEKNFIKSKFSQL